MSPFSSMVSNKGLVIQNEKEMGSAFHFTISILQSELRFLCDNCIQGLSYCPLQIMKPQDLLKQFFRGSLVIELLI